MATDERVENFPIAGSGLGATRLRQGPVPGALFIHGWTGQRRDMAGPMREVAAAGFTCLDYDLRGHAATAAQRDRVTLHESVDDAVHAWEALVATPGVDADAIAVVGSSFGAWLSMLLATRRPVRWLVLRVPALYPDTAWDRPKESLDPAALDAYRTSPPGSDPALAACAAFEGEVLLVWSGEDERLPPALSGHFGRAFPKACSLTVRTLPGADHGLTGEASRARYRALIGSWLGDSLLARRKAFLARRLGADRA